VHLLVVLGVHEVVILTVVVQIFHFHLFEDGLLHLVFGREPVLDHGAVL